MLLTETLIVIYRTEIDTCEIESARDIDILQFAVNSGICMLLILTNVIDFDQIGPQWLTLTEFGVIGGVTVILIGALGIFCKQCWDLIIRREEEEEEEEEEVKWTRIKAM